MSETDSSPRQFLRYVAYLQVIGCLLVVLGHSFHEYPDGSMGKSLELYRMFFTFRMPLFMFVSGFLMVYTGFRRSGGQLSLVKFTGSKLKRLLLPFFTLTLFTFYPRAKMSFMADEPLSADLPTFLKSFFYIDYMPMPFLWFLQASFLLLVFCFGFIVVAKKVKLPEWGYCLLLLALFVVLPLVEIPFAGFFSIGQVQRLGIYFVCGIVYAHFHEDLAFFFSRYLGFKTFLFGVVWCGLYFSVGANRWGAMFCSFAGIGMCICLAHWLVVHRIGVLDHLVGATYLIFLLSWFFTVLFQQVLHHFVSLPWWIYTLLSLAGGTYFPWLLYRWMRGHPDFWVVRLGALLLGQNIKPSTKR